MANHVRRQIREAIATAVTGLATTGARVFQSRIYPLEATDLPGLRIYTISEASSTQNFGFPRLYERRLTVRIEACAQATADLDDVLDEICKEVETALGGAAVSLGGAKSITLLDTDISMSGDSEKPRGQAAMSWEVFYVTAENAPDVAL